MNCLYAGICDDFPLKCKKCRHNKGKKSFFEPLR